MRCTTHFHACRCREAAVAKLATLVRSAPHASHCPSQQPGGTDHRAVPGDRECDCWKTYAREIAGRLGY